MKQMLSAIAYCHNLNIMHRDLKPENILLEANKQYDQIKLIDFGTAKKFDPSKKIKEQIGTPYYIAPEILNGQYGKECDLWSLGVITFILLSGIPPFNGSSDAEIMSAIRKGKFNFNHKSFQTVSETAKDFITKLLNLDVTRRLTAQQALQHKWIVEGAKVSVDQASLLDSMNHLKSFHKNNVFKTATLSFISSHLTTKVEREELARAFK